MNVDSDQIPVRELSAHQLFLHLLLLPPTSTTGPPLKVQGNFTQGAQDLMMFDATPLNPSGDQMLSDLPHPPQIPNVDYHGTTSLQDPNVNHDVTLQDLNVNHPPLQLSSGDLAIHEVPPSLLDLVLNPNPLLGWNQVRTPTQKSKKKIKKEEIFINTYSDSWNAYIDLAPRASMSDAYKIS